MKNILLYYTWFWQNIFLNIYYSLQYKKYNGTLNLINDGKKRYKETNVTVVTTRAFKFSKTFISLHKLHFNFC